MSNENFKKSLKNAQDNILEQLKKNMEKACLVVVADAKKECPVDMGQLRASINYSVKVQDGKIVGKVGSNLDYAPYVHQGTGIYAINGDGRKTPWGYNVDMGKYKGLHFTRGQKPQPFLQKAITKNKDRISKILGGG